MPEKLDIKDLDAALQITEDTQLKAIYTNLRAGSERHLAAFSDQGGGKRKRKNASKGKGANRGSCCGH